MSNLALIVFMYYTSLWAVVSTLMVYVTRKLHFSPIVVGYFLSTYGLCTMVSEGVLVRILIPRIGEVNAVRIGLLAFAVQTVILAFSTSQEMIFASLFLSLLSNLVYPSISSLVSKSVPESVHGEALGTLNGIKALTEGVGPLAFGGLMYAYENAAIPGAPYLLATILVLWAWLHTFELPSMPDVELLTRGGRCGSASEGGLEATGGYQAEDTQRLLSSDPDSGLVEHTL
jgi:DHA1 family tetracycline resistance protein-like MFS transporter